MGVLGTRGSNKKIRRWALNALARFGRANYSLEPVTEALRKYADDPQATASAIAAIYKLAPKPASILTGSYSFGPTLESLAALQLVDPSKLDLTEVRVDIENSPPDLLKLGLIVVGLDRAPPNIFHPRYPNAEIVGRLGVHHDPIVSQYSIWAITENPSLGLADLGIDIKDVESQPANVRAWIFQLIAMSEDDAEANLEFIELGMRDPEAEARAGLAAGLRRTFFDGLEPLVLDWISSEDDAEVRRLIEDHIVVNWSKCSAYEAWAIELYEEEKSESGRQRMEANAAGTDMYGRFRRIAYSDSGDLFGGVYMTKNVHIHGNIQAGAVSLEGDAINTAPVSIHYDAKTVAALKSEMSKALVQLRSLEIDEEIKGKVIQDVELAQANPEPNLIHKAIQGLRAVEQKAKGVAGISGVLGTIISAIQALSGT